MSDGYQPGRRPARSDRLPCRSCLYALCLVVGDSSMMAFQHPATSFIHALTESKSSSALSPAVRQLLCEIGVRDNVSRNATCIGLARTLLNNSRGCERNDVKHNCTQLTASPARPTVCSQCQQRVLSGDRFINFDECANLLPRVSDQPDADYYINSVSVLAEVFRCSQAMLEDMPLEQFSRTYGESLLWTKNPELFLECFELLTHGDGADDHLSLLLTCAGLEHSLGNVFLLRGKQCPLMLKDLISARELEEILGPHVLRLLQIVIGPPTSMNIRNVSWHGFLSQHELPRRYIFFLLLLAVSLGKLLQDRGISHEHICARDYLPLTRTDDIGRTLGLSQLSDATITSLGDCLFSSWVVTDGNINFFRAAVVYLKHQQYGHCVVLLLPLLEHSLRRVFVAVNGCPHRLVTAEATSLYTTFEEILDKALPDGRENALVQVLGEPCMDLLHDLLIYPSGPRVRDKLGHGEADFHAVPESLAHILFLIFIRLARITHDDLEVPALAEMLHGLSDYSSVFHPVSLLRQRILDLCTGTGTLHADLHTSPGLDSWNLKQGFEVFLSKNNMFMEVQQALTQWLESTAANMAAVARDEWQQMAPRLAMPFSCVYQEVKRMLPHKLKTLYRWQKDTYAVKYADVGSMEMLNSDSKLVFSSGSAKVSESQIAGILSRIIAETETVLTQTRSALQVRQEQLKRKQLRSRQRDNLMRLLAFLPCASLLANYIAVLTTWQVCHFDDYQLLDSIGLQKVQRFLKSTLQTCENVRTYTSTESNKWSQAGQLLVEELKSAVKFSGQSIFPSKDIVACETTRECRLHHHTSLCFK